jgi:hypothetical protein
MRYLCLLVVTLCGCNGMRFQVSASYQISQDAKIEATLISLESRPSRVVIVDREVSQRPDLD